MEQSSQKIDELLTFHVMYFQNHLLKCDGFPINCPNDDCDVILSRKEVK